MATTDAPSRARARVEGTVQGVGFRPHVYRLATELGLGGFVLNDERGVLIEVEGAAGSIESFLERLVAEAPPLATVERVCSEAMTATGSDTFRIVGSARAGEPEALVSPDTATCPDCLTELFDSGDRRYRYPFVNCTNCGPRFTIVRDVPYDRSLTTMSTFAMCERCRGEYEDPLDRRFHAQPNACPDCGPGVRLEGYAGDEAMRAAADSLRGGAIVAVKGLGGFHLACRADDEAVVGALRSRKHREDKPFALMVADLAAARSLARVGPEEEARLGDRARPIVLAPRREGARIAEAVAPGARELGVMLPYSPLHHLLAADTGVPLVMTSANVSDEPIAYRDDEATARLATIADLFLLHDRPIHMRTDDSVLRVVRVGATRRPLMLRRSRGYVPASLALPAPAARPVLACGAELKSTFCLVKGARAWVGHHIGDLKNYETLRSFEEGVAHFERLFAVAPEVVAHDLHPDYLSTTYARARPGVVFVGIQHHHAHLAACLAEHGETGPAVGAIYDGAGLGADGAVWGGELLTGGLGGYARAGHLRAVRLPGGDRAAREPWRMACAWLAEALGAEPPLPPALAGAVDPRRWQAVAGLVRTGVASPPTTSMGRLFDAVAALCGVRAEVSYEGQAAIELEALADPDERDAYPLPVRSGDTLELDARETIAAVVREAGEGMPVATISARFHGAVARATAEGCRLAAERSALDTVVLSGGVFQNRLLLERTAELLTAAGLRVLTPERLPPGDGGISYGQAAVAAGT
jgi:hydrogenase maturation protein HypF